jgi:hypothetical protein
MLKKIRQHLPYIGYYSSIPDTTQIHKPAHINKSHNQLTQSILIISIYSITNPKVNSTLRITIQQIIQ